MLWSQHTAFLWNQMQIFRYSTPISLVFWDRIPECILYCSQYYISNASFKSKQQPRLENRGAQIVNLITMPCSSNRNMINLQEIEHDCRLDFYLVLLTAIRTPCSILLLHWAQHQTKRKRNVLHYSHVKNRNNSQPEDAKKNQGDEFANFWNTLIT